MLNAFLVGLISTSSLVLGGLIISRFSLSKRAIGIIMGFGAGTMISAISYELIFEAVKTAPHSGFPAYGFFAGAFTFFFSDMFIGKMSSGKNKSASKGAALIVPMVLGIILDGVPESIVLGLGMSSGGKVSMAMLTAVFVSNLPEAIAGSSGMKAGGWSIKKITLLWSFIALFCSFATVAGFSLFTNTSGQWLSFIQAFAGGAILMMLANSMIPEAFQNGGRYAGVSTVLGFFLAVVMVLMENS